MELLLKKVHAQKKMLKHIPFIIAIAFFSLPSFLNSYELKRFEIEVAEIDVTASHKLILERFIRISNLECPPYTIHYFFST